MHTIRELSLIFSVSTLRDSFGLPQNPGLIRRKTCSNRADWRKLSTLQACLYSPRCAGSLTVVWFEWFGRRARSTTALSDLHKAQQHRTSGAPGLFGVHAPASGALRTRP